MEYKMIKRGERDLSLEKHMESKGFFRNVTGSSKIGEIKLYDDTELDNTENDRFEDFLMDWEICYMELGRSIKFCLNVNGVSPISIGDKEHNIPIEERLKFLYESISTNSDHNYTPYNYLTIIYKDHTNMRYEKKSFNIITMIDLFDDTDIIMLEIRDY